jgi:streptomycin 6-kinase
VRVPSGLDWWRGVPGGARWLEGLPGIVEECADRWSLRVGTPFEPGHISLVVPVELSEGAEAILKVNFPESESEHEGDALRHWDGRGAIRLLAENPGTRALLIERCRPGAELWSIEDDEEATRIAGAVLQRLWRPPPEEHPFRKLATEAIRWARDLPDEWAAAGKPFDRKLLDEAVAACLELGPTQGEDVVLHQDFHGGNVLRAQREPWLAIDPKPLVGEREFDAASLLRDRRWLLDTPGVAAVMRRRLDLLASELGLDRERARRWGIAHAIAWGFSGRKVEEDMIECARILADASI